MFPAAAPDYDGNTKYPALRPRILYRASGIFRLSGKGQDREDHLASVLTWKISPFETFRPFSNHKLLTQTHAPTSDGKLGVDFIFLPMVRSLICHGPPLCRQWPRSCKSEQTTRDYLRSNVHRIGLGSDNGFYVMPSNGPRCGRTVYVAPNPEPIG